VEETRPVITYQEFKNLDLRVAQIISCEPHPNADKLLVMQIDLGGERRQIVAGLKPYYAPEQLVGRKIVVVVNLAPATLRGVPSNGMLLAAQSGNDVVVLIPEKDVPAGSKVL
jgi:methionyl-tRNA synthetase